MPTLPDFLDNLTRLRLLVAGQLFWASLLWLSTISSLPVAITLALLIGAIGFGAIWFGSQSHGPRIHVSISQILAATLLVLAAAVGWFMEPIRAVVLFLLTLQWAFYLLARQRMAIMLALLISPLALLVASAMSQSGYWLLGLLCFWLSWLAALTQIRSINRQHSLIAVGPHAEGFSETATSPTLSPRDLLQLPLILALTPVAGLLVWLVQPTTEQRPLLLPPYASEHRYDHSDWLGQAMNGGHRESSILTAESLAASEGPQELWDAVSRDTPQFDYPGFSERLDLFSSDAIGGQPDDLVLQVRSSQPLYLKAHTFDFFDGQVWTSSSLSYLKMQTEADEVGLLNSTPVHCQNSHPETVNYEVHVRQAISAWLPLAGTTESLKISANAIALDNWRQPLVASALKAGSRYQATALLGNDQQHPIACSPAPARPDLRVPSADLAWLRELALAASVGANNNAAKAYKMENWVRNNFDQSVAGQPPRLNRDRSLLVQVLQERQAASNEIRATALVMLLRSIEVPARLVTGFSATRYNALTGFYDVIQSDGHAWVEAWDGRHWLTLETDTRFELPKPVEPRSRTQAIGANLADSPAYAYPWLLFSLLLWPLQALITSTTGLILLALALTLWSLPTSRHLLLDALLPLRKRWWHERILRYKPQSPARDIARVLPWLQNLGTLCDCGPNKGESHESWCQRLASSDSSIAPEDIQHLQELVDQHLYEGDHVAWQSVQQQLFGADAHLQPLKTAADSNEIKELMAELANCFLHYKG
mgnify:CR=1 FL=1